MKKQSPENNITVVTLLKRQQVDFLDKLGKDARFKYGRKLARTRILSELVDLMIMLKINLEDIDLNQESLSEGLLRIIGNGKVRHE